MEFVVPEKVVTHFHLREGDVVGDFGAGSGFFEKSLSHAVGKTGKVYAFEIQKQLVERVSDMARSEHLDNVEVLWCDVEAKDGCKLKEGILDAGLLSNAIFQLEDKALALDEIRRMLRSGGKLFVIDWSESFGGMGPRQNDVLREANARTLVEQHGFSFTRSFPAGEHHYGLAFHVA
jgi:ubiquinone/menaquinone biosynthesis C-methylase UbiE